MTLILQINCLGDGTQAVLHVASHHGQCEVLSYLLYKRADIEMKVIFPVYGMQDGTPLWNNIHLWWYSFKILAELPN